MNIEEKILEIVKNNVARDITNVNLNSRLVEDLNVESIDKISIVMDIEQTFQVTINIQDIVSISTVSDIVNKVTAAVEPS
jgi:acyl carrier protein